jgi:hypothetical protein
MVGTGAAPLLHFLPRLGLATANLAAPMMTTVQHSKSTSARNVACRRLVPTQTCAMCVSTASTPKNCKSMISSNYTSLIPSFFSLFWNDSIYDSILPDRSKHIDFAAGNVVTCETLDSFGAMSYFTSDMCAGVQDTATSNGCCRLAATPVSAPVNGGAAPVSHPVRGRAMMTLR